MPTTGPLDRIKTCAGCRFIFVDESKNRSRRWCGMADRGTAAKIRRYVARRMRTRQHSYLNVRPAGVTGPRSRWPGGRCRWSRAGPCAPGVLRRRRRCR
ncbi:CGNR zinc finger domain-containing protein [Actinophytocola sp.]|uniref:CGNR zinc finger domain-containing protein n=1 Tax=Actinophytocola sp. TaxID=1872138 RepID=UPI0039C8AF53